MNETWCFFFSYAKLQQSGWRSKLNSERDKSAFLTCSLNAQFMPISTQDTEDMTMTKIQTFPLRKQFDSYVITTRCMNFYGNCLINVLSVNSGFTRNYGSSGRERGTTWVQIMSGLITNSSVPTWHNVTLENKAGKKRSLWTETFSRR